MSDETWTEMTLPERVEKLHAIKEAETVKPWNETHRVVLDALKDGSATLDSERDAIDAALTEIAASHAQHRALKQSVEEHRVSLRAALAEIARLQKEVAGLIRERSDLSQRVLDLDQALRMWERQEQAKRLIGIPSDKDEAM